MRIKSLIRKIQSYVIRYPKIENPIIIMTLLVKNEQEVLEKNLQFHKKMGVDGFIITDNGSTDGTKEIIQKYKKLGWIYHVIDNPEKGYKQDVFVDNMIRIAKDEYHADWVINADADEFWLCKNGKTFQEILSNDYHNVLSCNIFNMYPTEDEFWKSEYMIKNGLDLSNYNLPKYNLFSNQINKVVHRTDGYIMISVGNHNVRMRMKSIAKTDEIVIFHYNVRSKRHFYEKFVVGGRNVVENKEDAYKNIAKHWKYFYEISKRDDFDLDEVYSEYIGKSYYEDMLKKGYFIKETSVKDTIQDLITL